MIGSWLGHLVSSICVVVKSKPFLFFATAIGLCLATAGAAQDGATLSFEEECEERRMISPHACACTQVRGEDLGLTDPQMIAILEGDNTSMSISPSKREQFRSEHRLCIVDAVRVQIEREPRSISSEPMDAGRYVARPIRPQPLPADDYIGQAPVPRPSPEQ